MRKLSGIAVAECSWSDALLTEIKWENEGRDLVLSWMGGNKDNRTLTCTWACAIKIEICTAKNEGGYPLTWDIEFRELVSKGWEIIIDFGTNGVIELECNDITCCIS